MSDPQTPTHKRPVLVVTYIVLFWGLSIAGFVTVWSAIMPQVWGTIPVHTPIPWAAAYVAISEAVVFTFGCLITLKLRRSVVGPFLLLVLLLSGSVFLAAKGLTCVAEKNAIHLGDEINGFVRIYRREHGRLPSQQTVLNEFPTLPSRLFDFSSNAENDGWVLNIHSRFLPWWGISYTSKEGWFYQID